MPSVSIEWRTRVHWLQCLSTYRPSVSTRVGEASRTVRSSRTHSRRSVADPWEGMDEARPAGPRDGCMVGKRRPRGSVAMFDREGHSTHGMSDMP